MACGHHHFEARHKSEAPECWRHLNQAILPEVCITHLKVCKQVLAKNNSRPYIQLHQFEPEEPLQDDSDCFKESGMNDY